MHKKFKSKSVIFLLAFLILVNSASCSKSNLTQSTVKGFLDAVIAGKISDASDYLFHDANSTNFINSVFTFDNDQQKELAIKTFSKMKYKIKSTTKISDSMYKVTVEIESVDFEKITEEILPVITEKTNPDAEQTEAEINKMIALVNSTYITKLSEPSVPMIKNAVDIELFKDEAKTKISIMPDEDLLNSISGNLTKAYELIGDDQSAADENLN